MRYKFKEAILSDKAFGNYYEELKKYIDYGISITLVGIPYGSNVIFARYLATRKYAHVVYMDMYALPHLNRKEFFLLLLKELGGSSFIKTEQEVFEACKERLLELSATKKKIVIIVNRFCELKAEFTTNFFRMLWTLCSYAPEKIVMIFSTKKPYTELSPLAINDGQLSMFSEYIYFKVFSENELLSEDQLLPLLKIDFPIIKLDNPKRINDKSFLKKLIKLSGGHAQLFDMISKTEWQQNPLHDPYIQSHLRKLYDYLNYSQKKFVQKVALGKDVSNMDDYLVKVGYCIPINDKKYKLFSPLLAEYIKSQSSTRLSAKEAKLFKFFRKNIGKVVSKDEIFSAVWPDTAEEVSDWSLDSLIYRLRNNPYFQNQEFVLENQKKVGYILFKGK